MYAAGLCSVILCPSFCWFLLILLILFVLHVYVFNTFSFPSAPCVLHDILFLMSILSMLGGINVFEFGLNVGSSEIGSALGRYWLSVGAQPSDVVRRLLYKASLLPPPPQPYMPKKGPKP
jgi:hypothetical protein